MPSLPRTDSTCAGRSTTRRRRSRQPSSTSAAGAAVHKSVVRRCGQSGEASSPHTPSRQSSAVASPKSERPRVRAESELALLAVVSPTARRSSSAEAAALWCEGCQKLSDVTYHPAEKEGVVVLADAVRGKGAVVVHVEYAFVAGDAVVRPCWLRAETEPAPLPSLRVTRLARGPGILPYRLGRQQGRGK